MGKVVTFDLPAPPSVNHYYVRGRRGGVVIGKAGKGYREAVIAALREFPKLKGRLAVSIAYDAEKSIVSVTVREVEGEVTGGTDLDNLNKCLLDAIQHAGIYEDDGQIGELVLVK